MTHLTDTQLDNMINDALNSIIENATLTENTVETTVEECEPEQEVTVEDVLAPHKYDEKVIAAVLKVCGEESVRDVVEQGSHRFIQTMAVSGEFCTLVDARIGELIDRKDREWVQEAMIVKAQLATVFNSLTRV